jgi:hypothetical protein
MTIEKLFHQEIRDKKRTGSGAFHKRGKGVRHGMRGIKFQYDFLTAKEKRMLNGECVVSNMYTEIISKAAFDEKEKDIQKAMLTKWRELYSNSKIMKEMGITGQGTLAKYLKDLDVPKKQRGGKKPTRVISEMSVPELQEVKLLSNGLHLEYRGEYTSEQLNKIFTKLQLITDGEPNKYAFHVSLTERA